MPTADTPTLHSYFISFAHAGGFGWTRMDLSQPIRTDMDVRLVINEIVKANPGARAVTIIAWQRFED